ncbi:MAG: Crp/Fnr family transcriptional regulator [Brevundimonas sp.]|nr:MAG: Crp/Fnr family transcriptional regulator [Brevundimonas sp.]
MAQTETRMTADASDDGAPAPLGALSTGESPPLTDETLRLWTAFSALRAELRRWVLAVGRVERSEAGAAYRSAGRWVLAVGRVERSEAGAAYRSAGEVAVVVSGCLATGAGGAALTADVLGPGDVIATGAPRVVTGHWITAGEVYRLGLDDWLRRAGAEGLIYLLKGADRRRAVLERRLVCATAHLATARVADLLLSIQRAAPGAGILLSQAQLGAMLGLRRTTVNGSCRDLEQAGAVRTTRAKIRVPDLQRLAAAACGCRGAE